MRSYQSSDGTAWGIEVKVPSHSSAMVCFRHPNGETARRDRYAWYNAHQPEACDPRARLTPKQVLDALTDVNLEALFQRSMPVHVDRPAYVVS